MSDEDSVGKVVALVVGSGSVVLVDRLPVEKIFDEVTSVVDGLDEVSNSAVDDVDVDVPLN